MIIRLPSRRAVATRWSSMKSNGVKGAEEEHWFKWTSLSTSDRVAPMTTKYVKWIPVKKNNLKYFTAIE